MLFNKSEHFFINIEQKGNSTQTILKIILIKLTALLII